MADNFIKDKFLWLEQVAGDATLSSSGGRVAIFLSKYLNRKKGYAFPSVSRLARDLGMSEQGLRKVLRNLRDHGHIKYENGTGTRSANQYFLKIKTAKNETDVSLNLDQKEDLSETSVKILLNVSLGGIDLFPSTLTKTRNNMNSDLLSVRGPGNCEGYNLLLPREVSLLAQSMGKQTRQADLRVEEVEPPPL